jgi:hypothetical protein
MEFSHKKGVWTLEPIPVKINNHITVLFINKCYKMTFDDVSGHSYTLPAMARMNVPVLQIILVRLVL